MPVCQDTTASSTLVLQAKAGGLGTNGRLTAFLKPRQRTQEANGEAGTSGVDDSEASQQVTLLPKHLQYLNEVHVADTVALRPQAAGASQPAKQPRKKAAKKPAKLLKGQQRLFAPRPAANGKSPLKPVQVSWQLNSMQAGKKLIPS